MHCQCILFTVQRNRDGDIEYKRVMASTPDEMKPFARQMIKGCDKIIPKGTEACEQALMYNRCARDQDPVVSQ